MPWSGMFSRRRARRALTDMSASYAPLRDMTAVYEELSVKFVTPEGTQFDAWICFEELAAGNDHEHMRTVLKLWVQDHNLHAETLRVDEFIWIAVKRCTSTGCPCKVLFGRKPLYEGQTCMQLLFQNVMHLELFMHRIQASAQATV
tara:strand:+ start:146 stop:583 length:438 start_codon:yes stop_codon:yes gene_type:complete